VLQGINTKSATLPTPHCKTTSPVTCRDGGNTFTPERYRLELNQHTHSQGDRPPATHTQFLEFSF